jgi:hypothetical protein
VDSIDGFKFSSNKYGVASLLSSNTDNHSIVLSLNFSLSENFFIPLIVFAIHWSIIVSVCFVLFRCGLTAGCHCSFTQLLYGCVLSTCTCGSAVAALENHHHTFVESGCWKYSLNFWNCSAHRFSLGML